MRDHNYLGEFELMLLLTLIRLGDEAYGVPLSRELALMRDRDVLTEAEFQRAKIKLLSEYQSAEHSDQDRD